MDKKILIWCLLIIAAVVPLSLFFTGPMRLVKNIDGPSLTVPAGKSAALKIAVLPEWWTRFDLVLRLDKASDFKDLRASLDPDTSGKKPIRIDKGTIKFRFQTNRGASSSVILFNPTYHDLVIHRYSLTNYTAINTSRPRFALLLTPYAVPAFPVLTTLLLTLSSFGITLSGLFILWKQGICRFTQRQLLILLFFPWIILILAGALFLGGRHLLLSWEALLISCFFGYPLLALTTQSFKGKFFVSLLVFLIIIDFVILIGTCLGVGLPLNLFVLGLFYQPQFIFTAKCAGTAYFFLAFLLYWKRKDWFSPNQHLFLSSILLIFLPCLVIYLSNGYSSWGGDYYHNSLLPWRIIKGEGISYSKEYISQHWVWGLKRVGDNFLPVFPIGAGFFGVPTALINYLLAPAPVGDIIGWNQKVTAVWIASLSAAFIFQLIFLVTRKRWLSLLLASGFAFGTTQITISAAALWQHGPAVLLICLGLLFLVKGQQGNLHSLSLAALPLAFLPVVRPQTVVFYLAALASVICLQPKTVFRFLLWSLPGIFLTLGINVGYYHGLFGPYNDQASLISFTGPLIEGVTGSLFSPNRGLFVFSPFLVLGVFGGVILISKRSVIALSFSVAAIFFFLIHAKFGMWFGGLCIAPRFTSELVPILVFFSIYWFLQVKKVLTRLVGWALIIVSIAINLPGSFFIEEHNQWHYFPNLDQHQERFWDFRDWLPLHFIYRHNFEHFKETPFFAFVEEGPFEAIQSKRLHYRVMVPLAKQPLDILKVVNIYLKKGTYKIISKGDSHNAESAIVILSIDNIGFKHQELTLPIERQNKFSHIYSVDIEKSGYIDVRLKMIGKGTIIFDTVQLTPLAMK